MRLAPILLLVLACSALAQDAGDVELVIIRKDELGALLQRLARQQTEIERREHADREEKLKLGCT